ncbi:hypothetical protein [Bdellovibrio sp.]|uniref:hypothetical protein n=1 Tax=Bdellovibrio sp. TaxID=28201 RepID=UPI002F35EEFA
MNRLVIKFVFKSLLLGLAALSLSSVATAAQYEQSLRQFQVGGFDINQGGGSSVSPFVRYLPELNFNDKFSTGLSVMASAVKEKVNSSVNGLGELSLFGAYHFNSSFDVRLFVGAQFWGGSHGSGFTFGPEAHYHFGHDGKIPTWLDSAFIVYRSVNVDPSASEFGAGIGFKF